MDIQRKARDPSLIMSVGGKWESFSPVKPIRMDFEGAGKGDIIDHLEDLEKAYQVRLKNSDVIFQTAHSDYLSFRFLQWALISILIVSIFGFFGLALLREWQWEIVIVAMLVVLSMMLPLIGYINSQKRKLLSVLARYLQTFYKDDMIAGSLLHVWSQEHKMVNLEGMQFKLDDGARKELEEEMVRTILYLSMSETMGNLKPEEERIVRRARALLPSEVNHTITITMNEGLLKKITSSQK